MLRQDSTRINADADRFSVSHQSADSEAANVVDIQQELNRLEEMILDSPHIPLTGWTLVDEERLLDQLDVVRLNLPEAFQEAESIIQDRDEIFRQAEEYGLKIVEEAEQQADRILDEIGIIRQAEREAMMIRQRVQEECAAIQEETLAEIDLMRQQAQQELDQIRRQILRECEDIQQDADGYADKVLKNIEQQLGDMLKVIRNGRQQLQNELPPVRPRDLDGGTSPRTLPNSLKK